MNLTALYKQLAFLTILPLLGLACSSPEPPEEQALVNPAHLDYLYEEVSVADTTLGVVWIYCEAPDYHFVADEDEGFTCVDDVARAMVFYCRRYADNPDEELLKKIQAMTDFLLYMQAENGFFYNFIFSGPEINKTHQNSRAEANWWSWRAFWALSELNLLEAPELVDWQTRSRPAMDTLVEKMTALCPSSAEPVLYDGVAVPACLANLGADQVGEMMIGLTNYYRTDSSAQVKELLLSFGNLLLGIQQGDAQTWPYGAIMSWRNLWHAWGNVQAYALLYAGRTIDHPLFTEGGLQEVRHFYPWVIEQEFPSSFYVEQVADSLQSRDFRQFPQIAYNIRPMVFASLEAFAHTGDTTYAHRAGRLASWFFGNNPAGKVMYDLETGRTFDGISSKTDVNRNSGAESTIEALLSLQAIEQVPEAKAVLNRYKERN